MNSVPLHRYDGICLCETHIAGSSHVPDFARLKDMLIFGVKLNLVRELENPHDGWAIRIDYPESGQKLGYVPRSINQVPARLMDAGKELYAQVVGLSQESDMEFVRIALIMKD
ncbi:MAG TPA: HIRAN domain-containing protein [Methanocorpusculum sp.]|nr:HIRAN domain-containing protein [Candidatus Methanocorpusculum equi]HJJ33595.1 HIRAN domain-containing protein [Methanocorpusculum sp.]HJJ45028.1 HIRAN domain-containing protein [Methanocorpusculum sp.]HJJ58880.1 HIRAN domain-containing protein [Methanocorpusculum sp.]HJJ60111.1 HIRAN domain-containing protein [Methanocorpusculum sp.]